MPVATRRDFAEFTQYLVLDECAPTFREAFRGLRQRLEGEGVGATVCVDLVRRMTASEVQRLHLEPETGVWIEVRGHVKGGDAQ
jgi:hypothetical protein